MTNRAKIYDAVDLVWRNRVGETHNINPYLGRIQSRTLVMHITNDLWLNFKLAEKAVDRVPGADLIAEESPVAHYGVFSIINHRKNDPKFVAFMDDVASLDRAQKFVDKNYRVPGVAANIDPNKSFWKDYVTYPYPVKYATAKDKRGTSWQIGYMDEYAGTDKDPKVLVIIHGKGAFGGHYGNIMQYALRSGLRVIVPDLPHYGMSGPGNLDKSPARTMQDMREVVYDLVVNQLGVKKAAYLGHSLGGQLVMGYALTWPEAVQGLALEAPAGLEEYPREIAISKDKKLRLFDESFARDFDKWKQTWDQTGILAAEIARAGAEHPRLLLFQEARSSDWCRVGVQERLLLERQRVCPLPHRSARRTDQGQSEGAGAVVQRLHLRHLHHGGGAAAGRSEEPLRAAHPDQGADLPGLRRQGALHPGHGFQRPDRPRTRYHHAVHDAHDECGQPADPQDLSGYRALHPHGQPGGIRG